MAWSPEKCAGFALAALLADDGGLQGLSGPLDVSLHTTLTDSLRAARSDKAGTIARWLRLLRPALDERALALPARMRGLLARGCPAPLRGALLADTEPARGAFSADDELLFACMQIARFAARSSSEGRTP